MSRQRDIDFSEVGNILTVADDLLKNDGQKFLEMMEQLAERRMQREEEASADVEEDSEDEDDEGDEEDDEDDEDDEEDEDEEEVRSFHLVITPADLHRSPSSDHDGGAEDGGGQTHVLHFCCAHVRAARAPGVPREGGTRASAPASPRARGGGQELQGARGQEAVAEPEEKGQEAVSVPF